MTVSRFSDLAGNNCDLISFCLPPNGERPVQRGCVGRIHKHKNRYGSNEGLPVDRKISTKVTPRSSSSKM
jgi:hypothetical protein